MREILFRGKRVSDGEWVYGYYIYHPRGDRHTIIQTDAVGHVIIINVIPATIGQYTGLDDKNGVKIFEGDIIGAGNGNRFVIEYARGAFIRRTLALANVPHLCDLLDPIHTLYDSEYLELAEIIGNIHGEEGKE